MCPPAGLRAAIAGDGNAHAGWSFCTVFQKARAGIDAAVTGEALLNDHKITSAGAIVNAALSDEQPQPVCIFSQVGVYMDHINPPITIGNCHGPEISN